MPVYRCSHLSTPAGWIDGAVAVDGGTILATGTRREMERDWSGHEWRDPGASIVLPGLVNAHMHLELSWIAAVRPVGGDYTRWLRELLATRADEERTTARLAAEHAVESIVARGTVAVGDVCNETWIADVWNGTPLCGVLFHEVLGLGAAEDVVTRAVERIAARPAPAGWGWSVSPHAPHTTSLELLRRLGTLARERGTPCSVHVAESPAESALLMDGSGPLQALFLERGFLDVSAVAPACTPLERIEAAGWLGPGTLAVHAVQLSRDEIARLGASGATVVTCPRSNAYLDVGTAAVPELLAAGARLALGTDSLASCPDLDLFQEMAALLATHPGLAPATIVHAATQGGADALGLTRELGSIETGKRDRLTVVPFDGTGDPDEFLCSVPDRVFPLERAPFEVSA